MKTNRTVEQWPVQKLISLYESGNLDMDTEYQRDLIWSENKRELLIDSIFRNIDIPKLYLAFFTKERIYECIDGKQRIRSIVDFYNNTLTSLHKKNYKDLSSSEKSEFLNYRLSISIIQDLSDEDITELFYRLNSLGSALNLGEKINAMRGDMKSFIFGISQNGPFIGKVGIEKKDNSKTKNKKKAYRFARETVVAQMIVMSSIFSKVDIKLRRARYEEVNDFLNEPNNKHFNAETRDKIKEAKSILAEIDNIFGSKASVLKRKSVIVSAYFFCEDWILNKLGKNIEKFPLFYEKLLDEIKKQGERIKNLDEPTNKIVLEKFQKNLQQASVEGYSIERRQKFLTVAFDYFLKKGEIIGDSEWEKEWAKHFPKQ